VGLLVANKTWKKPSIIVIDIGKCRYCQAEMTNAESFVAFYGGDKAHYECMKHDDQKKLSRREKKIKKAYLHFLDQF
jgi:hypothetical protein